MYSHKKAQQQIELFISFSDEHAVRCSRRGASSTHPAHPADHLLGHELHVGGGQRHRRVRHYLYHRGPQACHTMSNILFRFYLRDFVREENHVFFLR